MLKERLNTALLDAKLYFNWVDRYNILAVRPASASDTPDDRQAQHKLSSVPSTFFRPFWKYQTPRLCHDIFMIYKPCRNPDEMNDTPYDLPASLTNVCAQPTGHQVAPPLRRQNNPSRALRDRRDHGYYGINGTVQTCHLGSVLAARPQSIWGRKLGLLVGYVFSLKPTQFPDQHLPIKPCRRCLMRLPKSRDEQFLDLGPHFVSRDLSFDFQRFFLAK